MRRDLSADESKQATALAILAQCWHLYLPSEHVGHAAGNAAPSCPEDAPLHGTSDAAAVHADANLPAEASSQAGISNPASSRASQGLEPAALDIRAHAAFWALLRACLVSRQF